MNDTTTARHLEEIGILTAANQDLQRQLDHARAELAAREPDDLDRFIREHAAADPAFAAAFVESQHAAEVRALYDLLAAIYPHVPWMRVTGHLALRQRDLWADAVDADWERAYTADPAAGLGYADRWWRR